MRRGYKASTVVMTAEKGPIPLRDANGCTFLTEEGLRRGRIMYGEPTRLKTCSYVPIPMLGSVQTPVAVMPEEIEERRDGLFLPSFSVALPLSHIMIERESEREWFAYGVLVGVHRREERMMTDTLTIFDERAFSKLQKSALLYIKEGQRGFRVLNTIAVSNRGDVINSSQVSVKHKVAYLRGLMSGLTKEVTNTYNDHAVIYRMADMSDEEIRMSCVSGMWYIGNGPFGPKFIPKLQENDLAVKRILEDREWDNVCNVYFPGTDEPIRFAARNGIALRSMSKEDAFRE